VARLARLALLALVALLALLALPSHPSHPSLPSPPPASHSDLQRCNGKWARRASLNIERNAIIADPLFSRVYKNKW